MSISKLRSFKPFGAVFPAIILSLFSPVTSFADIEIHYLDVGQADAALLIADEHAMLIDGGNADDSSFIYSYLKSHGIDHLDYAVATHEDEDHVGGLSGALNYASVDHALCSTADHTTKAFTNFKKYVGRRGKEIEIPAAGSEFSLGNASVKVLAPLSRAEEPNDNSIVLRVCYGDYSFLFTGDAEYTEECEILSQGYQLKSSVLKVGHHGSSSSTGSSFLRAVSPDYAIISVGKDNPYGHPAAAVLDRLHNSGATIYRTDENGTVVVVSDGKSLDIRAERGIPLKGSLSQSASLDGYILNTGKSMKFHMLSCEYVSQMSAKNRKEFSGTREEVLRMGYSPCGACKP